MSLAIAMVLFLALSACAAPSESAAPAEMPTPTEEICAIFGRVKNDLTFEGIDCKGVTQHGTPLQTGHLYVDSVYTIINNIVYTCTQSVTVWQCFPQPDFTVVNGEFVDTSISPLPATPQVQFENPILVAPAALEQYSLTPSATPVFSIGQFQPNYLEQSVPTVEALQTPPSDNSPYCFCGREGKDLVYGEISGGKKIEIKYIGVFEEITPVLTGSYKPIYTGYDEINLQNEERLIASIAPNHTIELTDGSTTNWQVIAVYCMPTNGLPYQTQALEYIQGGVYRVFANNVFAYYQTIGYEVRYIDNETGRGLDSNPPTSDQMVLWPIPGITIVP